MRIERVNAHAFGPFVDRTLELAPGMTVVCGPNEAGKSSWHAALYAGLCGMRRKPGRSGEDREFAERHRPWDGERWEVGVTVRLSDGRGVELRHNLANLTDCRASDTATGRDVSAEIMHENTPDGALYLGLTRRSLLPTICIRQADLLAVLDSSDLLQEHLQRAAATGGTDEPAERAIKRLRDYHSTRVGLERQNSTRPLMAAVRGVTRAEQDVAAAEEQHAAYVELVARRDHLAAGARASRDRRDAVLAAAARTRLADLAARVDRARELSAAIDGEPPPTPAGEDPVAAMVSSALAATARCFRQSCAIDSRLATKRVPSHTSSAPSISTAAKPRPSAIPPAATTGISPATSMTAGTSASVPL
jgi:DNA repair protein SbcC/Rad50